MNDTLKNARPGDHTKKRLVMWIDVLNSQELAYRKIGCCYRFFCCLCLACCLSNETVHMKVVSKIGKKISKTLKAKGIDNETYIIDGRLKIVVRRMNMIFQVGLKSKIEKKVSKNTI